MTSRRLFASSCSPRSAVVVYRGSRIPRPCHVHSHSRPAGVDGRLRRWVRCILSGLNLQRHLVAAEGLAPHKRSRDESSTAGLPALVVSFRTKVFLIDNQTVVCYISKQGDTMTRQVLAEEELILIKAQYINGQLNVVVASRLRSQHRVGFVKSNVSDDPEPIYVGPCGDRFVYKQPQPPNGAVYVPVSGSCSHVSKRVSCRLAEKCRAVSVSTDINH